MSELTTTSYAILGLLHLRPHTAYELATQSNRSLRFVWPTAPSRLYAEPKRLEHRGLITTVQQSAGPTRTRQQFRITPAGRRALRAWIKEAPSPPRIEAEVLLRVLVADAGTDADLRKALQRTRAQVLAANDDGRALLDAYASGRVEFPERLHLNLLWAAFVRDLFQLLHDWTMFAEREVEKWHRPADRGSTAAALQLLRAIIDDDVLLERRPLPRPARPTESAAVGPRRPPRSDL